MDVAVRVLSEKVTALEQALSMALAVLRGVKDGSIPLERLTVAEDGSIRVERPE